jgi:hypothetical protein
VAYSDSNKWKREFLMGRLRANLIELLDIKVFNRAKLADRLCSMGLTYERAQEVMAEMKTAQEREAFIKLLRENGRKKGV